MSVKSTERKVRRVARKQRRSFAKTVRNAKRTSLQPRSGLRQPRQKIDIIGSITSNNQTIQQEYQVKLQNSRIGRTLLGRVGVRIGVSTQQVLRQAQQLAVLTGSRIADTRLAQVIGNQNEGFCLLTFRHWLQSCSATVGETQPLFPEQELSEVMARPDVAVCFSGGGSRSAVASLGQMRALRRLELMERIRYVSATSGGAWFSIPFTFLPKKMKDSDFFGVSLPPQEIQSIQNLRENVLQSRFASIMSDTSIIPRCVAGLAVNVAAKSLESTVLPGSVSGLRKKIARRLWGVSRPLSGSNSENWGRVVGSAILKSLGLYSGQRIGGLNRFFTWSNKRRTQILSVNADLEKEDFDIVQKSRPYLITLGVLSRRGAIVDYAMHKKKPLKRMALFEMTPLYCGVGNTVSNIPSGYIEAAATDAQQVKSLENNNITLKIGRSHHRFSLSDMMAVSGSSAAALSVDAFQPELAYHCGQSKPWEVYHGLDGGYLDNQAIIPLLRRKTKKIVAFVNAECRPTELTLPAEIEHLFGKTKRCNYTTTISRFRKHILSNDNNECDALRDGLFENKQSKGVTYYEGVYQVLENPNMGTEPYEVKIFWYFLDSSKVWQDVIERLKAKDLTLASVGRWTIKSLKNFPNYSTSRLDLSAEEVALLSNYTDWCVMKTRKELLAFLQARGDERGSS